MFPPLIVVTTNAMSGSADYASASPGGQDRGRIKLASFLLFGMLAMLACWHAGTPNGRSTWARLEVTTSGADDEPYSDSGLRAGGEPRVGCGADLSVAPDHHGGTVRGGR